MLIFFFLAVYVVVHFDVTLEELEDNQAHHCLYVLSNLINIYITQYHSIFTNISRLWGYSPHIDVYATPPILK